MNGKEWREFVDGLKHSWKSLWRDRIDDKVKAEGIASEDYKTLFVDQGTVIIATRDFVPPNFVKILEQHMDEKQQGLRGTPNPTVGGWGKFIRETIRNHERRTRGGRPVPTAHKQRKSQLKKGGRGWVHRFE